MTQGFIYTNGGGTVTSVGTSGIATGGPITNNGTITVAAAVKADQTTGSSTSVAVVPGVQQYHASSAKLWLYVAQSGGTYTMQTNYNISSIVKNSTGNLNVNYSVPFTTANYAANATVTDAVNAMARAQFLTTSGINIAIINPSSLGNVDAGFSLIAYGTQ